MTGDVSSAHALAFNVPLNATVRKVRKVLSKRTENLRTLRTLRTVRTLGTLFQVLRVLLKNSSVRVHASFADFSS